MDQRVRVVGEGMIPFATPSRSEPYDVVGERAVPHPGYVYEDSKAGQAALHHVGQTGIPVG